MPSHSRILITSLLLVSAARLAAVVEVAADAPVVSPVQSTALAKSSLDIVAPVMLAGSDSASAEFQKAVLPDILKLVNTNLSETLNFAKRGSFFLDPTKLFLSTESTARVYFIGEGAGYHNTLGFNTLLDGEKTPATALTADSQVIFPDASSTVSTYNVAGISGKRTTKEPLLPGDFVDLGTFKSGTTLDFFLIADGANGGKNAYAAPATRNPDRLDHVVAFALPDSPYLIIAFEDLLGGGDKDYNDVIFALDIGRANIQNLISTPEPQTWAILAGFLGVLFILHRRQQQQLAVVKADR
ncbi:MAG: DUF4114 domain-containing protein [Opitutaceae bacterium]|nr:DUF4114 domain-containing protein [Opitutaceae bacterium]